MSEIISRIEKELLTSFQYYADPEYNEGLLPISVIEFAAQGEITTPTDLNFMGYGAGPEGETFTACGGVDLEDFFTLDDNGGIDDSLKECFAKAAEAVLTALTSLSKSEAFVALPKQGPIVFRLDLEDQARKVLCRIHPDGEVELPPKK